MSGRVRDIAVAGVRPRPERLSPAETSICWLGERRHERLCLRMTLAHDRTRVCDRVRQCKPLRAHRSGRCSKERMGELKAAITGVVDLG